MSAHSVPSDATVVSDPDEDPSLEEVIIDLMRGSGLYASMKSQVAKFIEETGKLDAKKFIRPDRADENVLLFIYEYLQWVGMKQTCSMLLFESPIKIDASAVDLSEINEADFCPKLHRIIVQKENSYEEEEEEEDDDDESLNIFEPVGDVPGRHRFSGKSFSASELKISDKDFEVNGNTPHQLNLTPKALISSAGGPRTLASKVLSEERMINFSFEEPSTSNNYKDKDEADKQPSGKLNSTPESATTSSNRNLLDVTFTPEQPMFTSRNPIEERTSTNKPTAEEEISSITSESEDDEKNPVESIRNNNIENEDDGDKAKNLSLEDDKSSPDKNQNLNVDKNLNSVGKKSSGGKDSYANDEFDDISTSEMLSLEIEEDDTQDISVATDSFGMSACDHIVNLK